MLARVSALASAPFLCGRLASLSWRARPQQQSVLLRQLLSEEPLKLHLSYSADWPAVESAFCKLENPGSSRFSGPSTRAIPLNVNAIGLERRTPTSKERGKAALFQPLHHKDTNRGEFSYIRCSSSGNKGEETSDLGEMVGRKADGPKRTFQIVVAATQDLGIGQNGSLPWKLPGDMRFFKQVTTTTSSPNKRNAVVMGRKTWDSIPPKFRPLPGRLNVVLTRTASDADSDSAYPDGVLVCASLDSALSLLASADHADKVETVFVIGGGQVYREAMASPLCDAVHLTEVDTRGTPLECDTFMPPVDPSQFRAWSTSPPKVENDLRYSFVTYVRTHAPAEPQKVETNGAAVAPNGVVVESTGRVETAGGAELGAGESAAEQPEQGAEREGAGSAEAGAAKSAQVGMLGKARSGSGETTGPGAVARLPKTIQEKHEELQYLRLIDEIIRDGAHKGDRTGTGTISKFGCSMRFNLRKSFPTLTTKRVFWRGVVEELLWFVAGATNARLLQDRGVHIWDGNGSRAYLDSIGLTHREEHDLGPVYGFQWRHFGAKYTDMHADYTGQGVDQLADLIHRIKTKPEDRRLILSAWNPADLQLMALPPCHMFCQFYVADGELSCQMYQRSCDMGLGVPFNIASYSLLTLMIAQVCGLRPGDFVHVLGDAHVYTNHVEPLQEQLRNTPRPFPTLKVNPAVKDIDSFTADDFELIGYEPHKKIAMKMAV